jgi:hypothetical protein
MARTPDTDMDKNNLQDDDLCPVNDSGRHRYFIFKTIELFEPYHFTNDYPKGSVGSARVTWFIENSPTLYQKVEYAIFGCNCGSAIKKQIKQA